MILYPFFLAGVFLILKKALPGWTTLKAALVAFGSVTALFALAYFLMPEY